ncbi:hypothetical protein [Paraburkholderia elongata]|uniref:Uncharacterized protein n=1 Tax=Paraburkholderia elongata TaxID=2675747 RepID=A0A972P2Z7_9BURK|nr:hypothetical protein [Paraburkholderia elongata]NPT62447.1 hypothetical protein [Paraburkholderia elongata]
MKKLIVLFVGIAATSVAMAQASPPHITPPSGISPQQGLGTPQAMGHPVPTGLVNGTATVPSQATPSPSFPGIAGGGVYGALGGTSAQNPTNPGTVRQGQ